MIITARQGPNLQYTGRERLAQGGGTMPRRVGTVRPGYTVIYRPWVRHWRTGKIIWARHYGIRAFRIIVKDD